MNKFQKGKVFERESYHYLKSLFPKVKWLSKNSISSYDFEVGESVLHNYGDHTTGILRKEFEGD